MLPITFKNSSLCATVLNTGAFNITAGTLAGRYKHENFFSINLGRGVGHTACAVELAEYYVSQDIDVFIVTHSTTAFDHLYADNKFFTQCRVFNHRAKIAAHQFRGRRYANGAVIIADGNGPTISSTAFTLRETLFPSVADVNRLLFYAFG